MEYYFPAFYYSSTFGDVQMFPLQEGTHTHTHAEKQKAQTEMLAGRLLATASPPKHFQMAVAAVSVLLAV